MKGTRTNCERFFTSIKKCCADSLSVCPAPVCIIIRKHKNDHVRTLKIMQSMSEFGGLRTHEKTQHALVGLGSAALAVAVCLPIGKAAPVFRKGIIQCMK